MPLGDRRQDIAQIGFGVQAVELGVAHNGVVGSGPCSAGIGAGEQVVFPADGNASHGILGNVVVDLQPSVGDKSRQCFMPIDRVAERLGERGLRRQLCDRGMGPGEEVVQQRDQFAAPFESLGDGSKGCTRLDGIGRGNLAQRLLGRWGFVLLPVVEKSAARVRPARDLRDRARLGARRSI